MLSSRVLVSALLHLCTLSCPFGKMSVPVSGVTQHGLNCLFLLGWDVHYGKWVDTGTDLNSVGLTRDVLSYSPPWCLYVLISLSDLLPTLNCSFGGKKHLKPGGDSERWSNTRFGDLWYLTNVNEPLGFTFAIPYFCLRPPTCMAYWRLYPSQYPDVNNNPIVICKHI